MKTKIKIIGAAVVVFFILFQLGGYFLRRSQHPHAILSLSGNIEATEVRLSFQVAGRIKEMMVDEGHYVKKGDIVAKLDTEELIKIKAKAAASAAEAKFSYKRLEEDLQRAENLFKVGSVPEYKKDATETSRDMAKSKWDELESSLELAQLRLGYSDLVAPLNGFVLVRSAEVGENVQVGSTIFTVADLESVWLTAYINETDLGKVKLNQKADIKIDSYPDKVYKGRISFISQEAEFTPKHIQTKEERTKLVYRVKIIIENPEFELKPGMPADAYLGTV